MITEDYVSFETAKLLKEKGFDEPVQVYVKTYNYPSDTVIQNIKKITGKSMEQIEVHSLFNSEDEPFFNSVEGKDENLFAYPTLQMAMKWLREVHKIVIMIQPLSFNGAKNCLCDNWTYSVWVDYNLKMGESLGNQKAYSTYEEACEAAIKFGMFFVDNKNRI